jgi:hypothetical protein
MSSLLWLDLGMPRHSQLLPLVLLVLDQFVFSYSKLYHTLANHKDHDFTNCKRHASIAAVDQASRIIARAEKNV